MKPYFILCDSTLNAPVAGIAVIYLSLLIIMLWLFSIIDARRIEKLEKRVTDLEKHEI